MRSWFVNPLISAIFLGMVGLGVILINHPPETLFTQNFLKTLVVGLIALSPLYAFTLTFRLIKKTSLRKSIFQAIWFLVYFFSLYLFAIGLDVLQLKMGFEFDKIIGNLFALVSVVAFCIIQYFIFKGTSPSALKPS